MYIIISNYVEIQNGAHHSGELTLMMVLYWLVKKYLTNKSPTFTKDGHNIVNLINGLLCASYEIEFVLFVN